MYNIFKKLFLFIFYMEYTNKREDYFLYRLDKISKNKKIVIKPEQKEELLTMFKLLNTIYDEVANEINRKSMINYNYVIVKLSEIKEYQHIIDVVDNIKSFRKLVDTDNIWKKICQKLNWKFIQTVDPDMEFIYESDVSEDENNFSLEYIKKF